MQLHVTHDPASMGRGFQPKSRSSVSSFSSVVKTTGHPPKNILLICNHLQQFEKRYRPEFQPNLASVNVNYFRNPFRLSHFPPTLFWLPPFPRVEGCIANRDAADHCLPSVTRSAGGFFEIDLPAAGIRFLSGGGDHVSQGSTSVHKRPQVWISFFGLPEPASVGKRRQA